MTSTSFRDSVNSLGWSRRDPDVPARTSTPSAPFLSRLRSLNPFGGEGYVQLPTHENPGAPLPTASRREEEDSFLACKFSELMTNWLRRPVQVTGISSCVWLGFTRALAQSTHSSWNVCKADMNLYSEPMGSAAHIRRMQCRCRSLFLPLLFFVPSAVCEASQIRNTVSHSRIFDSTSTGIENHMHLEF